MKIVVIQLESALEILSEEKEMSDSEKKAIAKDRKELKALREKHPIRIDVKFNVPWWA